MRTGRQGVRGMEWVRKVHISIVTYVCVCHVHGDETFRQGEWEKQGRWKEAGSE